MNRQALAVCTACFLGIGTILVIGFISAVSVTQDASHRSAAPGGGSLSLEYGSAGASPSQDETAIVEGTSIQPECGSAGASPSQATTIVGLSSPEPFDGCAVNSATISTTATSGFGIAIRTNNSLAAVADGVVSGTIPGTGIDVTLNSLQSPAFLPYVNSAVLPSPGIAISTSALLSSGTSDVTFANFQFIATQQSGVVIETSSGGFASSSPILVGNSMEDVGRGVVSSSFGSTIRPCPVEPCTLALGNSIISNSVVQVAGTSIFGGCDQIFGGQLNLFDAQFTAAAAPPNNFFVFASDPMGIGSVKSSEKPLVQSWFVHDGGSDQLGFDRRDLRPTSSNSADLSSDSADATAAENQ